ncbi:hypothetical protein EX30DRAFT_350608 [Ascodesmis nigricans]|uniref:Uncharacterized protein n=1 Tax=Ascodesmis nigricans TaxID=341454 RepID=A0A4S2MP06_9PEZI|nr:hypothetical protein EX30DRAFT_350608 [Ascodesmis nigricans]
MPQERLERFHTVPPASPPPPPSDESTILRRANTLDQLSSGPERSRPVHNGPGFPGNQATRHRRLSPLPRIHPQLLVRGPPAKPVERSSTKETGGLVPAAACTGPRTKTRGRGPESPVASGSSFAALQSRLGIMVCHTGGPGPHQMLGTTLDNGSREMPKAQAKPPPPPPPPPPPHANTTTTASPLCHRRPSLIATSAVMTLVSTFVYEERAACASTSIAAEDCITIP